MRDPTANFFWASFHCINNKDSKISLPLEKESTIQAGDEVLNYDFAFVRESKGSTLQRFMLMTRNLIWRTRWFQSKKIFLTNHHFNTAYRLRKSSLTNFLAGHGWYWSSPTSIWAARWKLETLRATIILEEYSIWYRCPMYPCGLPTLAFNIFPAKPQFPASIVFDNLVHWDLREKEILVCIVLPWLILWQFWWKINTDLTLSEKTHSLVNTIQSFHHRREFVQIASLVCLHTRFFLWRVLDWEVCNEPLRSKRSERDWDESFRFFSKTWDDWWTKLLFSGPSNTDCSPRSSDALRLARLSQKSVSIQMKVTKAQLAICWDTDKVKE